MSLDVIVGPMFSDKTTELINRIKKYIIAKKDVIVFKIAVDTRWKNAAEPDFIRSHSGLKLPAVVVKNSGEAHEIILSEPTKIDVVAFDEIQFFDVGVIDLIKSLIADGVKVIAAGLDQDFTGEPFGYTVPVLLCLADRVKKLKAVCVVCNSDSATRTQRLVEGGKPAKKTDPVVVIGEKDIYEARCKFCHIVK